MNENSIVFIELFRDMMDIVFHEKKLTKGSLQNMKDKILILQNNQDVSKESIAQLKEIENLISKELQEMEQIGEARLAKS